jgi:predicted DNA-binding protein YlxM (UPF0122 family)
MVLHVIYVKDVGMDFKEIDEKTNFRNPEELKERAESLGFEYISEAVVLLYDAQQSLKKVGDLMGVSKSVVWNWLDQWEVEFQSIKSSVKDDEMSIYEIADEIGISFQAVDKLLKSGMKKFRKKWVELYGEPEGDIGGRDRFFINIMKHASRVQKSVSREPTFKEELSRLTGVEVE